MVLFFLLEILTRVELGSVETLEYKHDHPHLLRGLKKPHLRLNPLCLVQHLA
jgi:hypothetical protein